MYTYIKSTSIRFSDIFQLSMEQWLVSLNSHLPHFSIVLLPSTLVAHQAKLQSWQSVNLAKVHWLWIFPNSSINGNWHAIAFVLHWSNSWIVKSNRTGSEKIQVSFIMSDIIVHIKKKYWFELLILITSNIIKTPFITLSPNAWLKFLVNFTRVSSSNIVFALHIRTMGVSIII